MSTVRFRPLGFALPHFCPVFSVLEQPALSHRNVSRLPGFTVTYCLGWKTRECAYLVADTAVTSTRTARTNRTSFGELHRSVGGQNVEEAALKIAATPGAAMTFSGDAALGLEIARVFESTLGCGIEPREALDRAIKSHTPFGSNKSASLLCVFHEAGKPRLLSFNTKDDQQITEHGDEVVQLGSLKQSVFEQLSEAYIREVRNAHIEGRLLLTGTLALCQNYGVRNDLIQHGVGGAFCGGFVDSSGFQWQPDIGYLLFKGDVQSPSEVMGCVFAAVRNNVFVVRSVLGESRCFTTRRESEKQEDLESRVRAADMEALELLTAQKFQYLTFINVRLPIVAVIEMGRKHKHRSVILDPTICETGYYSDLY